jgi:hypothetical protein
MLYGGVKWGFFGTCYLVVLQYKALGYGSSLSSLNKVTKTNTVKKTNMFAKIRQIM